MRVHLLRTIRPVCVLSGMLVTALLGVVVPLSGPGSAAQATPAKPKCVDSTSGVSAASAVAKACARRVEATELRSPSSQVFVNPSGTMTMERSLQPRWAKTAQGSWVDVDTSLRRTADGAVRPVATVLPVVFSGGGSGPMATLKSGDRELSVYWSGELPAPSLTGDSAIYPEVRPGVDLKVTASAAGFTHLLVVKTRAAAADPALRKITFPLRTKGVTTTAGAGGVEARDGDGRTVFTSPTALMWDSGRDRAAPASPSGSLRSAADRTSPRRQAAMSVEVGADRIAVIPDATLLTDPEATLPLYIDPPWTGQIDDNKTAWTSVWSNFPDKSFWNDHTALLNSADLGAAGAGVTCNVSDSQGNCASPRFTIRSYFRMDISGVKYKQILKARFRINQKWAWTCNPSSKAKLWMTNPISPATTWNNPPAAWPAFTAEAPASHRVDARFSCAGAGDVEFDATNIVIDRAKWGSPDVSLALTSVNESNEDGWKRFDVKTAVLSVDYNTPPNVPDQLTADGKKCSAAPWHPFVPTATPVLKGRVIDTDGDAMSLRFDYSQYNPATKKYVDIGSGQQNNVPSGSYGQVTTKPLVNDGIYKYRARASDKHIAGTPSAPDASGGCDFQVDLIDPAAPTIAGDVYAPEDCPEHEPCGGVGETGRFTFTSSPDVWMYYWGFKDAPDNPVYASALGAAVTVAWTPDTGGAKTLYVKAVDRAGRTTTSTHQFYVSREAPAVGRWRLNDPAGSTSMADSSGNNRPAGLMGGTLGAPGAIVGGDTVLALDGTGANWGGTPPGVIDTGGSFSVSVWVKLNDISADHGVIGAYGQQRVAFSLAYFKSSNRWAFATNSADEGPNSFSAASSNGPPAVGVWTHLAGVYDEGSASLKLYVNGVKQTAEAPFVKTFSTGGSLLFGSGFPGSMADLRVWNRVVSAKEITAPADPLRFGRTGVWHMEDVGTGPTADASGRDHHLTFAGGAVIPPGDGNPGSALRLNGTDAYAQTAGPVVNTDQSFTVSARVRLGKADGGRTVVSQDGVHSSAFTLGFGPGCTGWQFTVATADIAAPAKARACSSAAVAVNTWTRLVGVYDATTRTVKLYVNGTPTAPVAVPATPWNATGPFAVGRGRSADNPSDLWLGDLDEVRVFQGVPSDISLIP